MKFEITTNKSEATSIITKLKNIVSDIGMMYSLPQNLECFIKALENIYYDRAVDIIEKAPGVSFSIRSVDNEYVITIILDEKLEYDFLDTLGEITKEIGPIVGAIYGVCGLLKNFSKSIFEKFKALMEKYSIPEEQIKYGSVIKSTTVFDENIKYCVILHNDGLNPVKVVCVTMSHTNNIKHSDIERMLEKKENKEKYTATDCNYDSLQEAFDVAKRLLEE